MFRKTFGLAVATTVLASSQANASVYCFHSGAFSACASAIVLVHPTFTSLRIQVQNLSGIQGNTVYSLTGVGLYYLGATSPYTGNLTLTSPLTNWKNGFGFIKNLGGPSGGATFLGGAGKTGPNYAGLLGCGLGNIPAAQGTNTCSTPQTFVFSLTNTSNFSLQNLDIAFEGFRWQKQTGGFLPQDGFRCFQSDPNCVTVPEPLSMTLLATGLVGLAGAGALRRRRRSK